MGIQDIFLLSMYFGGHYFNTKVVSSPFSPVTQTLTKSHHLKKDRADWARQIFSTSPGYIALSLLPKKLHWIYWKSGYGSHGMTSNTTGTEQGSTYSWWPSPHFVNYYTFFAKDNISYQYYYYLSEVLLYDLIHHLQQNRLPVSFCSSQQFQPILSTTICLRAYHLVRPHVN